MGQSAYTDVLEQAKNGWKSVTGTTEVTGDFGGILIIEDAVINTWTTDAAYVNSGNLEDSVTFSAGAYIPVRFSAVTLTSGTALAINKY